MHADLIIYNIGELVTPNKKAPVRGTDLSSITKLHNAFIAIKGEVIIGFGEESYDEFKTKDTVMYDALCNVVLPGLIDSHTHLVHGGSREHEFGKKLAGVPYLEILKQGGGILSTVNSTRESSFDELYYKAYNSLDEMLLFGVTTIEAKSGYGLNLETELKQLEVANKLDNDHPIDIVSTYLGAHAVPVEYKDNKNGYIETVITDMEIVYEKGLADFVDIFCEDSVFNYEDSKRILSHAKEVGFDIKIHADEIVSLGGAKLACEVGCTSADHLMAVSDEDIKLLGKTDIISNILPCTSFYLNKDYAPVRLMIEQGCAISISSDYNPGSSPSENFQFTMQLGANKLRMKPEEVLNASTINAAYNLNLSDTIGSIEVGKHADIVIMNCNNLEYILYHYGINHTKDVFKNGILVVRDRTVL